MDARSPPCSQRRAGWCGWEGAAQWWATSVVGGRWCYVVGWWQWPTRGAACEERPQLHALGAGWGRAARGAAAGYWLRDGLGWHSFVHSRLVQARERISRSVLRAHLSSSSSSRAARRHMQQCSNAGGRLGPNTRGSARSPQRPPLPQSTPVCKWPPPRAVARPRMLARTGTGDTVAHRSHGTCQHDNVQLPSPEDENVVSPPLSHPKPPASALSGPFWDTGSRTASLPDALDACLWSYIHVARQITAPLPRRASLVLSLHCRSCLSSPSIKLPTPPAGTPRQQATRPVTLPIHTDGTNTINTRRVLRELTIMLNIVYYYCQQSTRPLYTMRPPHLPVQ